MASQKINPAQKRIAVAKVNDTAISQYQVEIGLETLLEPFKDTKGKVRLSQPEQYAARKQVIDNLIMRELLYQEGMHRGLHPKGEEIDTAMAAAVRELGSEQKFKAMLVMQGLSLTEYIEQLKKDIIINKMAASIVEGKKKPVTREEARAYYDENRDAMTGPELRRVLHIMLPLDRYAPPEDEQKARALLEDISQSAQTFEKALSGKSKKNAQLRCEDLGYIMRGQYHPMLDSIAFRMKAGEVSRIIRTEDGLHVLLVKTVLEEGKRAPFDLIEDEITKKLYEMRSVEMVNRFTEELKRKATVEIYDRIADSKLSQEQTGAE